MRMSLLKAPKSPDDTCDMGEHDFDFALFPYKGALRVTFPHKGDYMLLVAGTRVLNAMVKIT